MSKLLFLNVDKALVISISLTFCTSSSCLTIADSSVSSLILIGDNWPIFVSSLIIVDDNCPSSDPISTFLNFALFAICEAVRAC